MRNTAVSSKRSHFLLFLSTTLLALIFCSCSGGVVEYYPLEVGNRWAFRTTSFTDTEPTERTDYELIVRRDGNSYQFENGETILNNSGSSLINKQGYTLLQTPFKPGISWEDAGATMTITALGKPVEVPAGKFTDTLEVAWEIKRPGKEDPTRFYIDKSVFVYAKGVGPIRYYYEVMLPDGQVVPVIESKLVSFKNIRAKKGKS
jgi:hypothetical protein